MMRSRFLLVLVLAALAWANSPARAEIGVAERRIATLEGMVVSMVEARILYFHIEDAQGRDCYVGTEDVLPGEFLAFLRKAEAQGLPVAVTGTLEIWDDGVLSFDDQEPYEYRFLPKPEPAPEPVGLPGWSARFHEE